MFFDVYSDVFEKAKIEARKRGHQCFEQQLTDGSIKLTIQLAGGATR
jgi:hypothetical protein